MNPKIQQLLDLHDRWLTMKRECFEATARSLDFDREQLVRTLTREELNEYYQELERQYPIKFKRKQNERNYNQRRR